jgi:hypothetical protein
MPDLSSPQAKIDDSERRRRDADDDDDAEKGGRRGGVDMWDLYAEESCFGKGKVCGVRCETVD